MAKEVKAWEAADGTVHKTADAADKHSCGLALAKCCSPGIITEIMKSPRAVYDALGHLYHGKPSDGKGS